VGDAFGGNLSGRETTVQTELPMSPGRTWWTKGRPFTLAELIADGSHGVGMWWRLRSGRRCWLRCLPDSPGQILLSPSMSVTGGLLSVSLAFNLVPISPIKRTLARFDQAAIFLFIAGSYTPFLAIMGGTRRAA
jgi:hemolysin III